MRHAVDVNWALRTELRIPGELIFPARAGKIVSLRHLRTSHARACLWHLCRVAHATPHVY
jgi:hypothetical protein